MYLTDNQKYFSEIFSSRFFMISKKEKLFYGLFTTCVNKFNAQCLTILFNFSENSTNYSVFADFCGGTFPSRLSQMGLK